MALTSEDLVTIETILARPDGVAAIRQHFPNLLVTRCDESDIDTEEPFRVWPHLRLYLVDGSDHCWRLTTDSSRATGLVLATPRRRA